MRKTFQAIGPKIINLLINVFWSILFFWPLLHFWILNYAPVPIFSFLVISLGPYLLPQSLFKTFQLSRSRKFYESLAIHQFQKITQNGAWIKKLQQNISEGPEIKQKRHFIEQVKQQMYIYETFHWACAIFFTLSIIYAITLKDFHFALLIFIANVFYNLVPILIQQYNRCRLSKM